MTPPAHRCTECGETMLYVDGYRVCPRGHGRLIGGGPKKTPPELTIVQNDYRRFKMPKETG